jgi:hypothetical protein
MKTNPFWLGLVAGLTALSPGLAADPAVNPEKRIEVTFSHPEKFSDVRDGYMGSDQGRDGLLGQLKDYIVQRAQSRVPEGQKLSILVTEVDLAGDFEAWHGPQMSDVRVVKDVYPPKIDLEFKLTGPDGKVVKEGQRQLRDLAFMMKLSINRDDNLRFEKALVDDWLRDELPRPRAK